MRSSHEQWLADYHRRADEARLVRARSASLLSSSIVTEPCRDPATAGRYEQGTALTRRASGRTPSLYERLPNNRDTRFDEAYPGTHARPSLRTSELRRRKRKVSSRVFGSWSDMPPELRFHFTEKERAALHVVAMQFQKHGFCDWTLKEIGDLAGCHRSTVKSALGEARKLGLVKVSYRKRDAMNNLPNVVIIVSPEWLKWLESLAVKKKTTLKNSGVNRKVRGKTAPSQGAYEGCGTASAAPSGDGKATRWAPKDAPLAPRWPDRWRSRAPHGQ